MNLHLIALPWAAYDRPVAALGVLSAYVRASEPDCEVTCHYAYLSAARRIGLPLYERISEHAYLLGEMLYAALLYPQNRAALRARFPALLLPDPGDPPDDHAWSGAVDVTDPDAARALCDHLLDELDQHLIETAARYDWRGAIIGLSTCFGQTFANLLLARRIKQAHPDCTIVLGGSTVSNRVGPSLLREYPWIDHAIQGEGEQPLVALIRHMRAPGQGRPIRGVVSAGAPDEPAGMWEVQDLDTLPIPDYDAYFAEASSHHLITRVPIEGSRGCWWDRSTRRSKSTCYFCNLNVQWNGYRQKSAARVVAEMRALCERYSEPSLYFVDNIIRVKGFDELVGMIQQQDIEFRLFYEARANLRPAHILDLWEAGVTEVQFGIEGLSTSLLERINKGTTTIMNLEAMKTCHELGIVNRANLIVDFPGSTDAEVAETATNIRHYACIYTPLASCPFWLGIDSVVDRHQDEFPITNLRNRDEFRAVLPPDVYERLILFDRSYDVLGERADWTPVTREVSRWRGRQARGDRLLEYLDGGSFLKIIDRREDFAIFHLDADLRELYLYCTQYRRRADLIAVFTDGSDEEIAGLTGALDSLVQERLVFCERDRYLALALAPEPRLAARRIRRLQATEQTARATGPARRRASLPVAGQ